MRRSSLSPVTQRHRHVCVQLVPLRGRYKVCWRDVLLQLFGNINSRRRTRLDDSLHQQEVVGANNGVARNPELLRKLPRGRKPNTRSDPVAADRLADLVDDLRRKRVLMGPVEEDGYHHRAALVARWSKG